MIAETIYYRWQFGDEANNDITNISMYAEEDSVSATAWSDDTVMLSLTRAKAGGKWQVDSAPPLVPPDFYSRWYYRPVHAMEALYDLTGVKYVEGDEPEEAP